MWKKKNKIEKKVVGQEKQKKHTKLSKVILASSSEVRKIMLNQYFSKVINVPHNAEEENTKTKKKSLKK